MTKIALHLNIWRPGWGVATSHRHAYFDRQNFNQRNLVNGFNLKLSIRNIHAKILSKKLIWIVSIPLTLMHGNLNVMLEKILNKFSMRWLNYQNLYSIRATKWESESSWWLYVIIWILICLVLTRWWIILIYIDI